MQNPAPHRTRTALGLQYLGLQYDVEASASLHADDTGHSIPVNMTPAASIVRLALVTAALVLPTLSLAIFGGLYLWEKGWVLWWSLGALAAALIVTAAMRWLLPSRTEGLPSGGELAATTSDETADDVSRYSPAEQRAWREVRAIAQGASLESLTTVPKVVELGQRTIEAVAARLHAEKADAIWRFTLPEAFAIIERVSDRLGYLTETRIPFGDRLTVAQVLAIYRWRGLVDVAGRAYDVWRVIRMANPATAATAEARERLSHAMLVWGRDHLARRLVQAYVEEVGRAAIDLYGGRLASAVARGSAVSHADAPSAVDPSRMHVGGAEPGRSPAPIAIVVLGSSRWRAELTRAIERASVEAFAETSPADPPPLIAVDATGAITAERAGRRELLRHVTSADAVVWIVDADSGARASDIEGQRIVRDHYAAEHHQLAPPLVVLVANGGHLSEGELSQAAGELVAGLQPVTTIKGAVPPANQESAVSSAPLRRTLSVVRSCSSSEPQLAIDARKLIDAIQGLGGAIRRVRALRELDQARKPAGWFSSGRQAVKAVANLTSAAARRTRRTGD